jgi:hypothetical protein
MGWGTVISPLLYNAQVTGLLMGLVGDEVRPGEPANYPLAWPRDGAYVVVALVRSPRANSTGQSLSPALKPAKLNTSELSDGYAFQFPPDPKTFAMVSEWVGNERIC